MIPKTIHYCWFGQNEYSNTIKKCIKSWEKHLPDYTIKLWNESNMPMEHPFLKDAYKAGKYAFVADYARLYALYKEGGVYLDTDMFLIRKLDSFLNNNCFLGNEEPNTLSCGIIGCKKNDPFIKKCLDSYDNTDFNSSVLKDISIPKIMSSVYERLSSEEIKLIKLYAPDYFYPYPYIERINGNYNFKTYIKPQTAAVHLWDASWLPEIQEYADVQRSVKVRIIKLIFWIKEKIGKM